MLLILWTYMYIAAKKFQVPPALRKNTKNMLVQKRGKGVSHVIPEYVSQEIPLLSGLR